MVVGKFSHHEIVEIAANIEERGYNFYTRAAQEVEKEPARNILLHLAEEEKKHEAYFRKLYDEIENEKKSFSDQLDEEAVRYLRVISQSTVFPIREEEYLKKIKGLGDVIQFGKQAEKDSILFYMELLRYAPDEDSERMFEAFIKEEKKHLVKLQELEALIEERDVYY